MGRWAAGALCGAAMWAMPAAEAAASDDPPKNASAKAQDTAFQLTVNAAIDRGVKYLQSQQHRDGSFTGGHFERYRSGPTALAAYAMVESGVPATDPGVALAVDFLTRHPPRRTYSAGAALLLLAEIGGKDHLPLAQSILDDLVEWENDGVRGTWAYPDGGVDLSNVQFAALGFWGAKRLGLNVPLDVCKRMAKTTIDRYQEKPRPQEGSKAKEPEVGRSRAGEKMVAGFSYHLDATNPPTGSMTVAGICIQRILLEVHGRKIGRKMLLAIDKSVPLAMAWLEEQWSVTENPVHGGRHLYYLWGVERMAALLDKDTLFGWDWYREGAEVLLKGQRDDGGWSSSHETSYALLFLARATRAGQATASGPGGNVAPSEFAWRHTEGVVQISATGSMDVTAWIHFIDEGIRVERVEWLMDGEVVATAQGDPRAPWNGQKLPMRFASDREVAMKLVARVHGIDQDGELVVESRPLEIKTQWTPDLWFKRGSATVGPNLLRGVNHSVKASSELKGQEAGKASDDFGGTAWGPEPSDKTPAITFTFDRPIKAKAVTIAHGASSVELVKQFAGATRIRLTVNGEATEHDLPEQFPGVIVIPFPEALRIRSLKVTILATEGTGARRGFAEIGLR